MTTEELYTEENPAFFRDVICGFHLPEEWRGIVDDLCSCIEQRILLNKLPMQSLQVTQVKSKFGGLRFYYNIVAPAETRRYIEGAVNMAERACWRITNG